jgi:hypothetical protein
MRTIWVAITLWAAVGCVFAQTPPRYQLDGETTPGKEVVVSRPQDGLFPVRVILNVAPLAAGQSAAAPPKPVRVIMSQFSGDRSSFPVEILYGCQSTSQVATQPLVVPATGMIELCLRIPPLPGDGKYTGSMLISDDAGTLVKPFAITGPQATLVGHSISPQFITLPFLSRLTGTYGSLSEPERRFTIVLSEKSGNTSADNLMASLAVSKSPDGFDMNRNMLFKVGKDVLDLESGPPAAGVQRQLRRVPARGQLGLDVSLFGLEPGEYNAVLGFSSPNSVADESQKQNLVIQVRDSIWWAVIFLVLAVSISFLATKVLAGLRWRANMQRQILNVTPQWFSGLAPTLAVVWVRAVLHQANRLSAKFWLTSPDLIEAQVKDVSTTLKVLDQVHQLRGLLTRALDQFLLRRVLIDLDNVVSNLDAGAPDDATVARIQTDLKTFEDWLAKDKILTKFASDVMPDIRALDSGIASSATPEATKAIVEELKETIQADLANTPTTIEGMNELYRKYARLMVLCDEINGPPAVAVNPDLMKMLAVADDGDWARVKLATLRIRMPASSSPDGLEAFVPLQFSVESDDPVAASYLFKHKIQYAWSFTLNPQKRTFPELVHLKRQPVPATLTPLSLGPSVVQYFPRSGDVRVAVELRYQGESVSVTTPGSVEVSDSKSVGFFRKIELAEVGSWLIAAGAAVVTGLSTYYFKNQSFGSVQDYLSLLIWGVGVDQTKSFVQNLQAFSTTPTASPAPAP